MQATTTTTTTMSTTNTRAQDRSGFRVSRWFANTLGARPEPRGVGAQAGAMRRGENDDDNKHEGQGGWHASSLELAAGLQVWEVERAEAEDILRRHFHHHCHFGVKTAVQ
jgi:hypothetical protein